MTGSIVLAADQPAQLARFYGALLDVEPQQGVSASHWRVRWPAGGWLEVYAPSRSRPQAGQQGRLALCLQRQADGTGAVAVLNVWITAALGLGASLQEPPRQDSFGAEAWLLDPEGNRLLLLVLPRAAAAAPWREEPAVAACAPSSASRPPLPSRSRMP
ncbi:MAG: VOC family protein [Synechococcaceae cyanobacterium]